MHGELISMLRPYMEPCGFRAGEKLTGDLAASQTLYYLEDGAVLVESYSVAKSDQTKQIGLLKTSPCFMGMEYLFLSDPTRMRTTLTGLKAGKLQKISRAKLNTLFEGELRLSRGLIVELLARELADSLEQLTVQMEYTTTQLAQDKVVQALKEMGQLVGTPIDKGLQIPVKTSTLAKLSGMSSESTRRVLTRLMDEGSLAKTARGHFLIFN